MNQGAEVKKPIIKEEIKKPIIQEENKKPIIQKENKKTVIEISNNNEIKKLKRELEDEKTKNKKLRDSINQLKQNHNIEIEKYKSDINKLVEKNKELEKILEEKNKEINDYIFQLSNSNNNEQLVNFKTGDKIIAVLFMTQGNQDIYNYTMPCKTSDLFVRLEERLYHDFPKYRNYETFFMVNARRIFRFKSLEENQIKNNDIISLFTNE